MQARSQPVKAAGYMVGAMISFTLMAIAGRELSDTLDTFEIMMYRSFIGIIIVLAVARWKGILSHISTNRMGMHISRNVIHFTGQNLWFYALVYIPLSQLFAFEFTNPLWVAILAPFFLGEKMTTTKLMAFALGFIGILIVAQPQNTTLSFATGAAALCALAFAGTSLFTKKLTQTESTISIMFWLVTLQALFGLICVVYDGDVAVPTGVEIIWVVLVGFCGLLAHFCIATALRLAPVTVVAPLEFLRLPLIAVVGWILYNEPLQGVVFLGAALVLGANWMNISAEQKAQKKI